MKSLFLFLTILPFTFIAAQHSSCDSLREENQRLRQQLHELQGYMALIQSYPFPKLDKGIEEATYLVESDTKELRKILCTTEGQLCEQTKRVVQITQTFSDKIDALRKELIERSGGVYTEADAPNPNYIGRPKGTRDMTTTQQLFIEEGQGESLRQLMLSTRAAYEEVLRELDISDQRVAAILEKLPLEVDEEHIPEGKTWAEYTFGKMPVAAVLPMLRKFQNDVKTSEGAILAYFYNELRK